MDQLENGCGTYLSDPGLVIYPGTVRKSSSKFYDNCVMISSRQILPGMENDSTEKVINGYGQGLFSTKITIINAFCISHSRDVTAAYITGLIFPWWVLRQSPFNWFLHPLTPVKSFLAGSSRVLSCGR